MTARRLSEADVLGIIHERPAGGLEQIVGEIERLRELIMPVYGNTKDGLWCEASSDERALTVEASAIRRR